MHCSFRLERALLAVPILAVLGAAGCGQDDVTLPTSIENAQPQISSATIRPATVRRSGTARIHVEATDEATQPLSINGRADHGVVVFQNPTDGGGGLRIWEGTYTHDGSSSSDEIAITVTDPLGVSATVALSIVISTP